MNDDYEVELIECNKCDGKGSINYDGTDVVSGMYSDWRICPKCRGKRRIDWIENIIGVRMGTSGTSGSSGSAGKSNNLGVAGIASSSGQVIQDQWETW